MRLLFACVECGVHYLPPESMRYPDGPASPLWCSGCQEQARAAGIAEDPILARMAFAAARAALAAHAPQVEEPRRPDVRPSRPPVSRRAKGAPGGVRSKLG